MGGLTNDFAVRIDKSRAFQWQVDSCYWPMVAPRCLDQAPARFRCVDATRSRDDCPAAKPLAVAVDRPTIHPFNLKTRRKRPMDHDDIKQKLIIAGKVLVAEG